MALVGSLEIVMAVGLKGTFFSRLPRGRAGLFGGRIWRMSRSAQAIISFSKARAAPVKLITAMTIPATIPTARCIQKIVWRSLLLMVVTVAVGSEDGYRRIAKVYRQI